VENLAKSFSSLYYAFSLYPSTHPKIRAGIDRIEIILKHFFHESDRITIGLIGTDLLFLAGELQRLEGSAEGLKHIFQMNGIEKIVLYSGITREEIADFFKSFAKTKEDMPGHPGRTFHRDSRWPHIVPGNFSSETVVENFEDGSGSLRPEEIRIVREYLEDARELVDQIRTNRLMEYRLAKEIVDHILNGIILENHAIPLVSQIKEHDEYTFTHMMNVSTLCLATGRVLGFPPPQLRELGIASLLHDTGKIRIPSEILQKKDRLTEDEFGIVKRHPAEGAAMLTQFRDIPDLAPIVAFEHHIRYDGSGYPVTYKDRRPHLCSRITAIADIFDALRTIRSYRSETSKVETFQIMSGIPLDPFLLNLFARISNLHPVGEMVRLDTGEIGIVHEINPRNPYRPRVKLLYDAENNKLNDQRIVNLTNFHKRENRYLRSIDSILTEEETRKLP